MAGGLGPIHNNIHKKCFILKYIFENNPIMIFIY